MSLEAAASFQLVLALTLRVGFQSTNGSAESVLNRKGVSPGT